MSSYSCPAWSARSKLVAARKQPFHLVTQAAGPDPGETRRDTNGSAKLDRSPLDPRSCWTEPRRTRPQKAKFAKALLTCHLVAEIRRCFASFRCHLDSAFVNGARIEPTLDHSPSSAMPAFAEHVQRSV